MRNKKNFGNFNQKFPQGNKLGYNTFIPLERNPLNSCIIITLAEMRRNKKNMKGNQTKDVNLLVKLPLCLF
jgi:hypothetical protein